MIESQNLYFALASSTTDDFFDCQISSANAYAYLIGFTLSSKFNLIFPKGFKVS